MKTNKKLVFATTVAILKEFIEEIVHPIIRIPEFWKQFRVYIGGASMLTLSFYSFLWLCGLVFPHHGSFHIYPIQIFFLVFIILFTSFFITIMQGLKKDEGYKMYKWLLINFNPIMVFAYWPLYGLYVLVSKNQRKKIVEYWRGQWNFWFRSNPQ